MEGERKKEIIEGAKELSLTGALVNLEEFIYIVFQKIRSLQE
jgi:hypothetical protein